MTAVFASALPSPSGGANTSADAPPTAGASGAAAARAATPARAQAGAGGAGSPARTPPQDDDDAGVYPPPADAQGAAVSGGAIAIPPDDSLALVVNRDADSLSVLSLGYDKEALTQLTLHKELPLGPGSEPRRAEFRRLRRRLRAVIGRTA